MALFSYCIESTPTECSADTNEVQETRVYRSLYSVVDLRSGSRETLRLLAPGFHGSMRVATDRRM